MEVEFTTTPRGDPRRPLRVDDLFGLEELGEAALSSDGRWLVFVVRRARATANFHKYDFLGGGDRGDVWIVNASGGVAQNLTGGAEDGSGYWAPSWSPDSERLAMLSTKGGNVHLWGCDIGSRTLVRLSERPVDLNSRGVPYVWVSNRSLLVATLPEGERPTLMSVEVQAAESAMREWPKAWKGQEPTASALDSGCHAPFDERPKGELLLVDAMGGQEETVMRGFFRELRIAPDGRHVAFFRCVGVVRPHANRKLERTGHERQRLGIVTAEGEVVAVGVEKIEEYVSGSLRWSPDSAEVALIGRDARSPPESPRRAFRFRLADGRVEPVTDASLEPTSIVWTADRRILALARSAPGTTKAGSERADWWLVGGGQEPRNLTADMGAVPRQLLPEEGRGAFVGLADGDVLRLSVGEGRWTNLTASFEPKVAWLVWPVPGAPDGRSFTQLVLAVDEGTLFAWHSLDLSSGALSSLPWPVAKGWLLDFAPENGTTVPVAVDRTGSRLWISKPALDEHRAIFETNAWLSDIAEGELRRVDYRGLDGNDLTAWLILPFDYQEGRRCPLVTWIYPGFVLSEDAPRPGAWHSPPITASTSSCSRRAGTRCCFRACRWSPRASRATHTWS